MKEEAHMKLRLKVLLLSGVFGAFVWAQSAAKVGDTISAEVVLEGDYKVSSQEEFDRLIAASGGGRFAIGGNLIIDHSPLKTLAGLENLMSVGNFLFIESNPVLTSLAALSNIKSIVGLNVRTNDSLTNLEGLNNLARVERFVQIEGNPVLKSVAALSNLKEVVGHLHIVDNPVLTSLAALSKLTSVALRAKLR